MCMKCIFDVANTELNTNKEFSVFVLRFMNLCLQ